MLLTGNFIRSLDEKGRFSIPKRVREMLDATRDSVLFLAPGTDGSLALYPSQVFHALGERLNQASPASQGVRAFSRLFYAQALCVDVDRQGRIRIPAALIEVAGLQKEIVLVGVRDHIEVWDRERWTKYIDESLPYYDQIAEQAFADPGTSLTWSELNLNPSAIPTDTKKVEEEQTASQPKRPK